MARCCGKGGGMKDRFGRTIYMGWAEHELLWIEAALTLPRDERTAAFMDISEITGRTMMAIRFQAKRIRKRDAKHAAAIAKKQRIKTPAHWTLGPSQLRQPSMAQLMGCR